MKITYKYTNKDINIKDIIHLYKANNWSSANKPKKLYNALLNSDTFITAWDGDLLIGLGNAISDGYLVVYYPHLLVLPSYQSKGIGKNIMRLLIKKYKRFHQYMLAANKEAIPSVAELENRLTYISRALGCLCLSSGMAAITNTIVSICDVGDKTKKGVIYGLLL